MVKIRLTRIGAKKRPFYRIVAASSEAPRDGRFMDIIGTYDPLKQPMEVKVKPEKLQYWMSKGAKPTETVQSLLKKTGLLAPGSAK
ncbi:MAG: 30S ribosomal protein S16 [Pseudomonadota bacterium]